MEYGGDLINLDEAVVREEKYIKQQKGCYMYYFSQGRQKLW